MHQLKKYGQNFNTNSELLEDIFAEFVPDIKSNIVEIGVGEGALTDIFLNYGCRIYGYEIDTRLSSFLNAKYKSLPVTLSFTSFLDADLDYVNEDFDIIGAIPYHLSQKICQKLFASKAHNIYLIVQKEFGLKLLADNGYETAFALLVNHYFKVDVFDEIPNFYFSPMPKVDSILIRLTCLHKQIDEDFERFVKEFYLYKRKYLSYSLAKLFTKSVCLDLMAKLNLEIDQRVENLSLDQFYALYESVKLLKSC